MTHDDPHSRRTTQSTGSVYLIRHRVAALALAFLLLCVLAVPVSAITISKTIAPGATIPCKTPGAHINDFLAVDPGSPCNDLYRTSYSSFASRPFYVNGGTDSDAGTTYLWNFGDGTTATWKTGSHTFPEAGRAYTVTFSATNSCGTDSKTATITTDPATTGDIYLLTTPADAWKASVWESGSGPAQGIQKMLAAPAGNVYKIKISQYGYEPFEQTVVAKGGDFVCVNAKLALAGSQQPPTTTPTTTTTTVSQGLPVTNPPANPTQPAGQSGTTGSLYIISNPAGAAIFLDSDAKGTTPLTLTGIAPGTHTVLLKKSGYPDYSTTTSIVAGQVTTIDADLAKGPQAAATNAPAAAATTAPIPGEGSLSLGTTPQGAQVFIDGVVRGMTPATIPGLSAGQHTVVLKLDGYQEFNTTVSIPDGKTAEFNTALAKTQKSPGFAGVLAVLVIAGICLIRKRTV
jgi:PKD repeat protein